MLFCDHIVSFDEKERSHRVEKKIKRDSRYN